MKTYNLFISHSWTYSNAYNGLVNLLYAWIDKEIQIDQNEFTNTKPIIAIRPRGNQRVSTKITDAADKIVGWNTESIVSAIWGLA